MTDRRALQPRGREPSREAVGPERAEDHDRGRERGAGHGLGKRCGGVPEVQREARGRQRQEGGETLLRE